MEQIAFAGTVVTINCYSDLLVEWTHNSRHVSGNKIVGKNLILDNIQESDSGIYACSGAIKIEGGNVPFKAVSLLKVGGKFYAPTVYIII